MSRATQKELLTKALLARGYVLGTGRADRSTKYVTFVSTPTARSLLKAREDGTVAQHSIFLGKAGACRSIPQVFPLAGMDDPSRL